MGQGDEDVVEGDCLVYLGALQESLVKKKMLDLEQKEESHADKHASVHDYRTSWTCVLDAQIAASASRKDRMVRTVCWRQDAPRASRPGSRDRSRPVEGIARPLRRLLLRQAATDG